MKFIIFTDLDGSLLDHFDYSFEPARETLDWLNEEGVPIICCTSKTFAELIVLRRSLDNEHPFIVENGAAVYIPRDYFPKPVSRGEADYSRKERYHCYSFVQTRQHWQALISELKPDFPGMFTTFRELDTMGIAEQTGLSHDEAARANRREYSEPVLWSGAEPDREDFVARLNASGASVLQGGRFMHVSGNCDKGKALRWLQSRYQQQSTQQVTSIAAGDSGNDIAMLEAADKSLIIRSPVHQPPRVNKSGNLWITDNPGPAGWAEGINRLLPVE